MLKIGKSGASKGGNGKEGTVMSRSPMKPGGSGKSGSAPTKVGMIRDGKQAKGK